MFFKVFLFAVLCTVTLVECRVSHPNAVSIIKQRLELQDALDELTELIKNEIAKAVAELENIKDELQDQAGKIVDSIKEGLGDQITDLLQHLNELKEQAKQLGIDIKDCLTDREQQLIDIPVNFGKQIYQCGKDKVDEGVAIVNDAKSKVENAIQEVKEYIDAFNACDDVSFFEKWTCRAEVAYKITKAMVTIPAEISTNVGQAINLVSTLQVDLQACGFEKVNNAMIEAKELYDEIEKCIKSKINPSQLLM